MLGTETPWRELPPLIPPHRGHRSGEDRLQKVKQAKRQYEKRKAVGLCAYGGPAKAGVWSCVLSGASAPNVAPRK